MNKNIRVSLLVIITLLFAFSLVAAKNNENGRNNPRNEICPAIYEPVCGQVNIQCVIAPCDPIIKTFSNMCELQKNPHAKLLYNGECKTENTGDNTTTNTLNNAIANSTINNSTKNFGLCVREAAWKQQDCFEKAKDNKLNCSVQGLNNITQQFNQTNQNISNLSKKEQKQLMRQFRSQVIDMNHQCKEKYKEEKDQCKADFKHSKLLCIEFKCKPNQIFLNETNKCVSNTNLNTTQNNNSLQVKEFAFLPHESTIKLGESVTWTNTGTMNHTVTSDFGSELNSPQIAPDQNYTHIFNTTGTFEYHCAIHPTMEGKIIVE